MRLGPVWDLDRAFGDPALQSPAGAPAGWTTPGRPIAGALLRDPRFAARLASRWREVRTAGLSARLDAAIVRDAARLRASVRRDERIWPSTRTPGHRAEVARLRGWLAERVAWMDANVDRIGTP